MYLTLSKEWMVGGVRGVGGRNGKRGGSRNLIDMYNEKRQFSFFS